MGPSKTFAALYFCLAVCALCTVIRAEHYTGAQPCYEYHPVFPGQGAVHVVVHPSEVGGPQYTGYQRKAGCIQGDEYLPYGYSYPKPAVAADDYNPTYPTMRPRAAPATYVDPLPYHQAYPERAQPADFPLPPGYVMPTMNGAPVPAKPATPAPVKPSPAGPAKPTKPAPQTPAAPLSGPCNVEMNFTVCSTVGRTETYYNLKKKYEAPGHLPKLNIIAKKHERGGYFKGEAGCTCRTEFKMVASKEVTAETHQYYHENLKSFFEMHVTIDNTFPCMHYGDAVYSGPGCPAPVPTPAPAAANATVPPASANATVTPAAANATVTPAAVTTAPTCAATLSFTVCVADKAAFMAQLKREEKALAQSVNLKKKAFHKDLTFTDADTAGICPANAKAAIKVDIAIPAASAAESDALLQPVQAIGSLLVGQKLPSVLGGTEIGQAATVCS